MLTLLSAWMLLLKLRQVVNVLVDDDPEVILRLVRSNVAAGEGLGHGGDARFLAKESMQRDYVYGKSKRKHALQWMQNKKEM